MKSHVWSVSEISSAIAGTLIKTFGQVAIRGEITNFSRSSSGHIYFSLRDEDALISAICFSGIARKLGINIENGMEVTIYGSLDCYEGRSQYQIKVLNIKLNGIGQMIEILEERKERLLKAGIFDESHKKAIPRFCQNIGIITSKNGAVIHDILAKLEERFLPLNIEIYDSQMQGIDAVVDIISGIEYYKKSKSVQAIIIARGGGSFEDLFCFNDEKLVMAIYNSDIPIISAIGHETDYTLCDFVSDKRALTPTAAAEMISISRSQILQEINYNWLSCKRNFEDKIGVSEGFIKSVFEASNRFLIQFKDIEYRLKDINDKINHQIIQISHHLENQKIITDNLFQNIKANLNKAILNSRYIIYITHQRLKESVNSSFAQKSFQIAGIKIAHNIENRFRNILSQKTWLIENNMARILQNLESGSRNINQMMTKLNTCVNELVNKSEIRLSDIMNKIEILIKNKINYQDSQLKQAFGIISAYDYHIPLKRGYVLLENHKTGEFITRAKDLKTGMKIKVKTGFDDGVVEIK